MPKWIHDRAEHISAKNSSMSESEAWAIATQQSHALGKSPKGYGTTEGRRAAKKKFDTPKDDVKTDNPGELESKKVAGVKEKVIEKLRPVASWVEELSGTSPRWHMQEIQDALKLRNEAAHEVPSARTTIDAARAAYRQGGGLEPTHKAFREHSRATLKRDRARDLLHDHISAYREAAEQTHKARVQAAVGAGALAVPVAAVGVELANRETDKSPSMKTAGIAIQYDLEGRPKSAETSDEWLAAHFKDSGTFMVPDRLKDARVDWLQSKCSQARGEAFLDELGKIAMEEMSKESVDPRLTRSLIGAGLGAGLGGATGYVGTKAMEDLPMPGVEQPDHAGRNAAIGALLGGVTGAGLGYASGRSALRVPTPEMSPINEVHGAQSALEDLRKTPAHVPEALDPEKAQELSQYLEYLKMPEGGAQLREPSLRQRLNRSPGYLQQREARIRRGVATNMQLPDEAVVDAGRGKFGAAKLITPEEAELSLRRYQKMQEDKPSADQIARYAGIGAVAGPAIGALGGLIGGGRHWSGASKDALLTARLAGKSTVPVLGRGLAASATTGALASGAIPLIRRQLDQQAEKGKLKAYLSQYEQQQQAMHLPDGDGGELKQGSVGVGSSMSASEYSTPIEGPKRARQASYIPPGRKLAGVGVGASTSTSEFSGPLSYGGFPQVSAQYGPAAQGLQDKPFNQPGGGRVGTGPVLVPTVKTSGVPISPQAQFASASMMGKTPGVLGARGPSISQVAKPDGYGLPAEGAIKTH